MKIQLLSVVRAVFFASALTAPWVSAADGNKAEGDGTTAQQVQSDQVQSDHPRFNREALDINVYGLAYHPDREMVHERGLDNEFNPGLGLHYELSNTPRGITFAELGAYEDSGSSVAAFIGLGYQFKMGEHWRVGAAVALMNSETYNQGTSFVGMVPVVTYDTGRVKLNAVYFPKFGNYNKVAAFGFYLGIPFGRKPN